MRKLLTIFILLAGAITASAADVRISIGSPNLRIGVNLSHYPDMVAVPGYPVYYAPHMDSNYFFYDGLYWVYEDDSWYASSWYNGPWSYVDPYAVPQYVLRVPVRYYRQPPHYFRGWAANSAPRWGDHWGNDWQERRHGWDNWNHKAAPKPLPLPTYQRRYSGDHYPDGDNQRNLQNQKYRYQPRNSVIAEHYKNEREQSEQARLQSREQNERDAREANERRQQAQRDQDQQHNDRGENDKGKNDRDDNRDDRSKNRK